MTGTEDRPGTIRIEQRTDIGLYDCNRGQTWGYSIRIEDRHGVYVTGTEDRPGATRLEQRTGVGLYDRNRGQTLGYATGTEDLSLIHI